tara:strand:+ start:152 stop:358 length:207 start_codon:yes stop_codon:yes gene_type:complete
MTIKDGKNLYAKVVWTTSDVQDLFNVSEEQAVEFLSRNERNIQDRMVELGWQVIDQLGQMDDLERREF